MAFTTGHTLETLNVYLTALGKTKILEQGFNPASFSLSDDDVNYIADNENIIQLVPDITGDHSDDVLSLSKNYVIRHNIIRNDTITRVVVTPTDPNTVIGTTQTNNTGTGI